MIFFVTFACSLLCQYSIMTRYSGGIRPKSGDSIDIFKKFIVDCYELGKFKSSTPYIPSSNSGSISAPSSGKNKVSTFINNKSGSADDLIINHKRDDLDNQGSAIGLPFHDDTLQKLMIFDYGKVSAASTPSESPQKVSSSSSDGNALFDPFGTGNKSDFVATFPSTIPPTSTVPIDPFSSSSCTPFSSSVDDLLFSPAPVASSNASAAPAESYSFLAQTAPPAGPSVDPFGSSGLLQPTVLHNSESSSTPSNAFHPFASSATTPSYHPTAAGPLWNVPPSAPTFGDTLPMRPPMQTHSNSFGAYSQPPFRVMNPPPASSMSISQINIPTYDVRGGPAYSNRTAPGARSAPSQGNDSFNFVSNTIRSQLESSSNRF